MLYIILYCFARLERQLQVRPELTNSAWSYQRPPDFLMTMTGDDSGGTTTTTTTTSPPTPP
jgi:hypothetical protein